MGNACLEPSGAVVMTTHERSGYFTAVLGDDIDLRFDPKREGPLEDALHNIIAADGDLVILDEAFFVDVDDLAGGLERFFRTERHPDRLRIIVVCTQREAGDEFLAFLVMYCGIYNIIYGKRGIGVSVDLGRLMRRDNTRSDVLHLAEAGSWSATRRDEEPVAGEIGERPCGDSRWKSRAGRFKSIYRDFIVDVADSQLVNVHISLTSIAM